MIVKTADLTDGALNWAAALAEGLKPALHKIQCSTNGSPFRYKAYVVIPMSNGDSWTYEGTEKWAQTGPLLQKENICFKPHFSPAHGLHISAAKWNEKGDIGSFLAEGPTPLVASLRCFVLSKLGNEVEIPDELL